MSQLKTHCCGELYLKTGHRAAAMTDAERCSDSCARMILKRDYRDRCWDHGGRWVHQIVEDFLLGDAPEEIAEKWTRSYDEVCDLIRKAIP